MRRIGDLAHRAAMRAGFELSLAALGVSIGITVGYLAVVVVLSVGMAASLYCLAVLVAGLAIASLAGVVAEMRQTPSEHQQATSIRRFGGDGG